MMRDFHALSRTWDIESDLKNMPAKSALSKKRGRVSFEFFKEQVDDVIMKYEPHCRTWRGLRVLCHRWRPVRTSQN
ncbi:MAG: hypothetical protein IPK68_05215 [Bdellovibrionales bacterium]|nr:hypothetical protein [Bdellovibrionales bacterium]